MKEAEEGNQDTKADDDKANDTNHVEQHDDENSNILANI